MRASGVLGRSHLLLALFDFLVARSAEDRAPKESEIAYAVFNKSAGFETGQDAVVRVYVHRLRRKLEDYAKQNAAADGCQLILPKGEYRLAVADLVQIEETPPDADPQLVPKRRARRSWIAAAVGVLLLVNVAGWGLLILQSGGDRQAAAARRSPVWAPFAASPLPLMIVTGDYYIFGESDDGMNVQRLKREYAINSPRDLSNYLMAHPEQSDRYVDLGLAYLPTSSAAAVADIANLFSGKKPVRVMTASDLTPQILKSYDIVYIGYISGLGPLHDPVFSDSRFAVGESYDEILDHKTGRRYSSQAAMGPVRGDVYRDYSYVSVFDGPGGNHVAILAGSRDIGTITAAEQATTPDALRALDKATGGARSFEALYEVKGQGEVNFQARVLAAAARKSPTGWADEGGRQP